MFTQFTILQKIFFRKTIVFATLCFSLYILYFLYYEYNDFFIEGYSVFGAGLDNNALWRLMFWSYTFVENVLNDPLFGIGFGTKLFDINNPEVIFITDTNSLGDLHFEYTLGTHNSFLFVLIRLGLLGFIPLLLIYIQIFYRYKKYNFRKNNEVTSLFLAFLFISIEALFNVVLESPIYSGIYWILLGMLYQSMKYHSQQVIVNDTTLYSKPA